MRVSSIPETELSAVDRGDDRTFPSVSVIMPVRNEGDFIERSLGAVLSQDYPHDRLEVIVADGGSEDATREIVARMAEAHPDIRVLSIDNPRRIVPTALNLGLATARGEIIVRVDGHTIIAPDYVRQCVALLRESGADNVGGRMEAVSESRFGQAVSLATSTPFGVGGARFHYSAREEWVDTVYMGAWPRHVFERIGTFDEEQVRNQDDELNYRLLEKGGRILLSPRIRSRYYPRTTLRSLWRQYYQYGYWKVRVAQKHPTEIRYRQLVPSLFVVALSTAVLLSPLSAAARWCAMLVAGCYLAANLAASLLASRGADRRLLPRIALAFATIHVAYGLGFSIGLARFWNRWADRGMWSMLAPRSVVAER